MASFEGRRVTVVGTGLTGSALVKFLAGRGALVGVSEAKPAPLCGDWVRAHAAYLERTEFGGHTEAFLLSSDLIVVSPGVPLGLPALKAAAASGVPVVGELEVALAGCPARVAAVTGTNGKTTTTALLGHLLAASGVPSVVAGNIGVPVSQVADEVGEGQVLVLEVSSFQLDAAPSFHPAVGALLNVTPDHLDRYPSFDAYAASKAALFARQDASDLAVLNRADPRCAALAPVLAARVRWFDASGAAVEGAGVEDGWIVLRDGGGSARVLPAAELPLPGSHNLENALAACVVAAALGATPRALSAGLTSFPGVDHRLEPAGTAGGVRFVNDSKATNVDAMERALTSFPGRVVLIAGGRDKRLDFGRVRDLVAARVRAAVLIGEAAAKIEEAWRGAAPLERAATLEDAVARAHALAGPGGLVLLSPGCASFDMFRNFEDRGRQFKEAVRRLAARLSATPKVRP